MYLQGRINQNMYTFQTRHRYMHLKHLIVVYPLKTNTLFHFQENYVYRGKKVRINRQCKKKKKKTATVE